MNLLQRALRGRRDESRYSLTDYLNEKVKYGGINYPSYGWSYSSKVEDVENSFVGYINGAYKANGVVYATILARQLLFSEARFQFQQIRNGKPGDLFGSPELAILENPWPNGTTGELLARMEQDVSLAGNSYTAREGNRLRRLRPDWVSIILTAPPDEAVASDVAGYLYRPGGLASKAEPKFYLPNEIAHWSPVPDPEAQYRGMSWLTPVLLEIQSDKAATKHKQKFFDHAATPNMVITFKETVTEDQFDEIMEQINSAHGGVSNAYKTMYLAGGAEVRTVGANFQQMDFKAVQGAGETRIAAAGGVPPIIVGLSEGLSSATYSNYGMARRKFGDHWARPQWRSACAALSSIITVPRGSRLWFDDRDIAFLREDQKDVAEIQSMQANSIGMLTREGYTAESVVAAVMANDFGLLKHTGLFSVQLQPPGTVNPPTAQESGPSTESDEDEEDS